MESNHTYIQWLIPNFFQSRFNPNSKPLTISEIKKIESDTTVYIRVNLGYLKLSKRSGKIFKLSWACNKKTQLNL